MSGQEDLLKQAIELRKEAREKGQPIPYVALRREEYDLPKVEEVVEEPAEPVEPHPASLTPQQKLVKQVLDAKREERRKLEKAAQRRKAEKQRPKVKEPKVEVKEDPAPTSTSVDVVKAEEPKKVKPEPVVEKKPATVEPVKVAFKGTLTPSMRAFAPTVRKLLNTKFGSVSIGKDRAVVRNPVDVTGLAKVENLLREELAGIGVGVAKIDPIPEGDIGADESYRVFFTS